MQLRIGRRRFVQDNFQLTRNTTTRWALRYEYMSPLSTSATPIRISSSPAASRKFHRRQNGYPALDVFQQARFAPRLGISAKSSAFRLVIHGAYGIFFTPVESQTWWQPAPQCPLRLPETQHSTIFTPPATLLSSAQSHTSLNCSRRPRRTMSLHRFRSARPAEYIQQWSASVEKSLGRADDSRSRLSRRARHSSPAR